MYIIANLGSPAHWLILAVVALLIFGAKRLPDLARGLGKSMGEFKKARKDFEKELFEAENKKDEDEEKKSLPATEEKKEVASSESSEKKDA